MVGLGLEMDEVNPEKNGRSELHTYHTKDGLAERIIRIPLEPNGVNPNTTEARSGQ